MNNNDIAEWIACTETWNQFGGRWTMDVAVFDFDFLIFEIGDDICRIHIKRGDGGFANHYGSAELIAAESSFTTNAYWRFHSCRTVTRC